MSSGKPDHLPPLSPPQPFGPDHDVETFTCGIDQLDDWLKRHALHNEIEGGSRSFVVCTGNQVVGYYSLAAGSVMHGIATSKARRNMPNPVPVALLGRLAIDQTWRGRGLGGDLLRDAVLRVLSTAQNIGIRAMLVHAISEEAKTFYERFGFRVSPIEPMTLMLTIAEMRRIFAGDH